MKRTWFIGIDISKKTLDVVIYDQEKRITKKHFKVSNEKKGFKEILKTLKQERVKVNQAFICLEYCGIYGLEIGLFLQNKVDFSFISPLHIKRSLGLTRGKNDKLDAYKIARFCYLFRDELKPTTMDSEIILKLKNLMGERNRVVKASKTEKQVINELSSQLDRKTVKRANKRLKLLQIDLKEIEVEIVELIKSDNKINKNYKLLLSITGIGLVNAVILIIYSNNFEGIPNARSFACYCGVAPFEYSSGTSIRGKTRVSNLANKSVKANLTNAARSAIVHDNELKIYYKRKREEGKSHGTVINAVKFKIISRAYAVINRQTPFVKIRQAG
ncbi:MAG: IS110 family transposase [Flavobacteriaceae bacterium]|nr:IS110 family transposase [Flavobacteriaceae bacterium]